MTEANKLQVILGQNLKDNMDLSKKKRENFKDLQKIIDKIIRESIWSEKQGKQYHYHFSIEAEY